MSSVRYVIEIEWKTIVMVTVAVIACIYAYAHLCYEQRSTEDDKGG
jgi:hypothetical protein